MSSDLRDQLQATLGAAYTLDRELGGGGMSRVFVGHEAALGRDVVVKVLHPELASGVNVERFKREIQLAAQLQHPHIVPLLAAGETGGLPYLTMPYVDGRSLRALLGEHGRLPLGEAVSILRDVARALDYAHSRGVIHRDIKPDNVLLSRGSATVTDFGVAKAVSAARSAPGGTLTSVGTSIGTPAYMAPEQSAGDPGTDHRADLYAWGVMAYELLAGRTPFVHHSPHKLLAAHISETPEPITNHRPDCPPALAHAIMRCLAKEPAERPASAAELFPALSETPTSSDGELETIPAITIATRRTLVRALGVYAVASVVTAALAQAAVELIGLPGWVLPGTLVLMALGIPVVLFTAFAHHGTRVARTMTVMTPGGNPTRQSPMTRIAVKASPHLSWRRMATAGIVAVGVFAMAVVAYMAMRALGIGPVGTLFAKNLLQENDQVVVAAFSAPAEDSLLAAVVMEAVRTGLTQSRAVTVMQQSQVAAALQRMELPRETILTPDVARSLAEREGAKAIVSGAIAPARGGAYLVTMRLADARSGDELTNVTVTASDVGALIPAIDRGTRKLRDRLGESLRTVRASAPLERVTTGSIEALRKYTEATFANNVRQDYLGSIALLREAVTIDSNFALAWRSMGIAAGNAGIGATLGREAIERAYALRARLPDYERALVEASYYTGSAHPDRTLAIAAYERAIAIDPRNPNVLTNLGNTWAGRGDFARSESLYRAASALPNPGAFTYINRVRDLVSLGRLPEAEEVAEEYVRQFGGNSMRAPWNRWVILAARHTAAMAEGDYPRARALSDSVAEVCRETATSRDPALRADGLSCVAGGFLLQGRITEAQRTLRERGTLDRAREGRIVSPIGAALDSIGAAIWFMEDYDGSIRALDSLARHHPLASYDVAVRPTFPFVELYAIAGRPDRARAILAEYDRITDTAQRRLDTIQINRARGQIAMAEGDYRTAIRSFEQSATYYDGYGTACVICHLPPLAQAYDLAGQPDSVIAIFERYLESPWANRIASGVDPQYRAGAHKRLGELYEARGDAGRALRHLEAFAHLWERADPVLQPKVAEVRANIERLRRTGAR